MGHLITQLASGSGLLENDVRKIVATAHRRYKHYTIKKRNGEDRPISQPAKEVKLLQRLFQKQFLQNLPVHPSATAYEKGLSIKENAGRHMHNGPILKLDFKNFFPSIKASDWVAYAEAHGLLDDLEDRELSARLLFKSTRTSAGMRLAIGAPTSPHISNLLMYDFDRLMAERAAREMVTYTRYADDLTFSAKRTGYLQPIEKLVRTTLREINRPRLILNDEKTVFATTKYRRVVTGLTLTNDGTISIGRERKKLIRAMIHHYEQGLLDAENSRKLVGLLAFANDAEPAFVLRMKLKYGEKLMAEILGSS
jgi:retron-type reverse transcriptase